MQLIQRARRGDKNAFAEIYRLHHKRVYALCLRLAGQTSLAEEMTQDCFIRVWEKLDQFRGDSKFSTWLHSLSVNQALTSLKKHRRFWARFLPLSDHDVDTIGSVSDIQDSSLLDKKIMQLPERARIVFVLFAIEGYSHTEIASMMHTTEGTSKAQYHRAKTLLKEMLS
ncbi:RNA polymerase sigma factor [Shewanella yunxiaonensis]|uniref:RNA polymerase sigma factor n=1 Tax=Shewanella yunxiaonensis TaxID=2829809 RepID=A0ABX7Z065_9GAMM|nr:MULTISPECIES: RNA polymerase sigma factor [Shewanella]MDF0534073.1 RNA polymerase sigma factor [Shewanella sp. A32]QUN07661.1 RNA polymerase sigma factor [Shewanella yunxiaonensis]